MADDDKNTEIENDEAVADKDQASAQAGAESNAADPSNEKDSTETLDIDEDLAAALGDVEETDGVDIDQAIAEADPDFSKEIEAINSEDFSGVVINKENLSEEVDENEKVPSAYKTFWNNLPQGTKKRYYLAAGIIAVLIPFAILIYMGKILPRFELPYTLSFQELTKDIYSYPVEGVQVPLFDDYRTQAHTIQFPKTVINLRSSGDSPSYGEFEFSFVLRDEELSVAIKAKESEIVDLMQRVLEQVTWQELQSPIGKEKVKKIIRHRINEYLQGNVVIGVYYRHVVLEK